MPILVSILRRRSLILVSLSTTCVFAAEPAPVATLVEHGHYKQARPILDKTLSANPKDVSALVLMAKVKMAFLDNDGAAQLAKQAMEIDPKNVDAHVTYADA